MADPVGEAWREAVDRGGRIPGCRGQTSIRWPKEIAAFDERSQGLDEDGEPEESARDLERMRRGRLMLDLRGTPRPSRYRAPKVDHARARARIEAAGLARLEELDREVATSSAQRWLVRIYYLSAGDEVLCFDAGPFFLQTAERVKSENTGPVVYVPDARSKAEKRKGPREIGETWAPPPGRYAAEVFDRDEIGADAIAQDRVRAPRHGARLVVLPSQRILQVVDATEEVAA